MIEINDKTKLSENEIQFLTSKSSGPGGQNVNKVNTKVTLLFNVADSSGLNTEQKARIFKKLGHRITKAGDLQISAQSYRSQVANKKDAVNRFVDLIKYALQYRPRRRKTQIPPKAQRKRLEAKRHRGEIKKHRKKVDW